MTQEQKDEFWSILLDYEDGVYDFFDIWKFMEEKYPDLWERYLRIVSKGIWGESERTGNWYSDTLKIQLNLDNLLTFLEQNKEEWGWVECHNYIPAHPYCVKVCEHPCNKGKAKHPALRYLELEGL